MGYDPPPCPPAPRSSRGAREEQMEKLRADSFRQLERAEREDGLKAWGIGALLAIAIWGIIVWLSR